MAPRKDEDGGDLATSRMMLSNISKTLESQNQLLQNHIKESRENVTTVLVALTKHDGQIMAASKQGEDNKKAIEEMKIAEAKEKRLTRILHAGQLLVSSVMHGFLK